MRKLTTYTLALLGMFILFNSCKKEYESIESIDDAKILAYIKKNNIVAKKDPSGFYYEVINQGTGSAVANKDWLLFNLKVGSLGGVNYYATTAYSNEGSYLGYLAPESYRIALTGLNRGAKVKVYLPSYLAYGKNGSGAIPSNEVILTEINVYEEDTQANLDDKRIRDYLTANNLTATKDASGVYYIVKNQGSGETVDLLSTITAKYAGRTLNGTVFDERTGDPASLSGLIKGWKALIGMQEGAKVRLFIPSGLGYGPNAQGTLPASSVLDFDIELVDVTN